MSAQAVNVVVEAEPTQVRYPWRAGLRTALQVVITLAWFVPAAVTVVLNAAEEHGVSLPAGVIAVLTALSVGAAVFGTIVARVMALPGVEAWLSKFLGGVLAAAPGPGVTESVVGVLDPADVPYEARITDPGETA